MRGRLYRRARTHLKPKPWYERDGGIRLAHDRTLVTAAYPDLKYSIDDQAERVYIEGAIRCHIESSENNPLHIVIRRPLPIEA
jgi:hypothetical protein